MQNPTIQSVQRRQYQASSQALRIKRICSDESDYQLNSKKLLSELVERGYQTDTMKKNIEKANNVKTRRPPKLQGENTQHKNPANSYL